MAGLYDGLEQVGLTSPAPPPPKPPAGLYEGLERVAPASTPPRFAEGFAESVQAGFQGSAPGLAWRRRLPELVINPETAKWWERAAASFAHVGSELPLMIPAAAAGATVAAPTGPVGSLLTAGFAMGAVPATIRTSLTELYKAGDAKEPADWFNIVRAVAKQASIEGGINAAAMGMGAFAKAGIATAGGANAATARAIGLGTATPVTRAGAIGSEFADLTTQIAAMVTMPAVIEQRMPKMHEFIDAAILVGGLKFAHVTANRMMTVYEKTGRLPAEQAADAQADPKVAEELTAERRPPDGEPQTMFPVKLGRLVDEAEMLGRGGVTEAPNIKQLIKEIKAEGPLQGDMVADIDRIGAIYDRAREAPLTDPERAELEALRVKVKAADEIMRLRGEIRDLDRTAPQVFTGEQLTEVQTRAAARLKELTERANAGQLTDMERAERVLLNNARPEAIAKHFGIEPGGGRATAKVLDESAQRVHDDILRQLRDVDQARRDSGLQPLGEDHATAVAALVRARVRTRAARLGLMPEEVYSERPLQIRDETAAEVAAAEAAIPAGAPTFVPPEVDLFGAPVAAPMVPRHLSENIPVQALPVAALKLSLDVPQFKKDANEKGVVQPLGGEPDPRGWAVQVWERLNGDLEVISGRHRLELWQRNGLAEIPGQIHREADGFTKEMAARLDAELNIRDEQGSIADYAQYFKDSGLSKEAADERGLLARYKGKTGFAIARDGTPDLLAAHRAGVLSDEAALTISSAAPGSERLQALGMAMVQDGKSALIAVNTMKAVELMAAERMAKGTQGDIFGFDDSAMLEASQMAKRASAMQRKIGEQISAVSGASRRPELARKMGVDVQDPEGIQKRIAVLKQEQMLWDNWPLHPELVARLRAPEVTGREGDLKQGPVPHQEWRDAPLDEADYYKDSEVRTLEYKPYVQDGVVTANSRMVPNMENFPPVGSWRIAEVKGIHGREIEQLVELPIASLRLGELDSRGRLDPTKRGDDERYAEWLKEGKRAPPIQIVQTESGQLSVIDGHRRALAAQQAGRQTVEAWVNYAVPIPDGGRINSDPSKPLIRTGMTFEMLTGENPNPYLDRLPFSMSFELKPETPAELAARNAEALEQVGRRMQQEAAAERAAQGKPVKVDQADLFNTQNTLFQRERGSYQIAEKLITTMQGADKSTVIHELGHDWLEEFKADASRADAPAQIKADWETLRRELAIGESGQIERASHEQFARSVERYTGDGEAPSIALRGVFERFKAWLLEIYQSMANLRVQVNPELKAVLDRMLATDQEIADARALNVPRAYVEMAKATEARKIVPGFKAEQVALEPYADELPPGPGKAPDDSHVNYAGVDAPVKIRLTLQRLAEIDQENIQKHRGGKDGVESWEQEQATMEKWLLNTLEAGEDRMRLYKGADPNDPKANHILRAKKQMMVGAGHESERMRDVILEKGHNATIEEQLQYLSSIELLRQLHAEFLGERAAVARAMNALKDTTEGSAAVNSMLEAIGRGQDANTLMQSAAEKAMADQAMLKVKLDEILLRYKGKSVLDIAKLHKEIGTLKGTFKMAEVLEKASTWEMVVEAWKSGLLSGPVTHTTNLFGTQAFMFMRPAVDVLAATIGIARGASPGMGESDRASMSGAVARLTGMLAGVKDGLKVGYHTFRMDDPTGKTEAYRTAIPGRLGEIIRIPLRAMGAGDAVNQTMYGRGELWDLAIRQAFDEGLNPATREFADRVSYLKDSPTPEMQAIANDAATRMTFNMPLGEKGVYLQLFVQKWNLQWMIPFIRTPINITKEVARMSPFAPLVGEWRADIAKGGIARDRALAETALGSGIMALTVAYAFSGDITGGGSPDPGKNRGKAGVEQPYSWKIGDTYYEYARIQPMGTLMGMAADMAVVWDHMNDEEKDKIPKLLARAFSNAVTNQTFLQGITNVVNAMSEPARFAPKFLQQLAGSMVPNIIGQPTAMADPVVREVNSALEQVMSRVPGFRQELMPKRDWLGEEVKTKERLAVVGPVRTLEVTKDKVRLEAARLDISMAAAPKKTHIGKGTGKLGDVELTPEERNKFQKVGGEMAHRILANIVNAPGYDALAPLVQRKIFERVLTASHQVAAVAAMPPEKRNAYLQSITEKVQQELTPTE